MELLRVTGRLKDIFPERGEETNAEEEAKPKKGKKREASVRGTACPMLARPERHNEVQCVI